MKILIAGVLTALFFWASYMQTPDSLNNSTTKWSTKVQTVQAAAPEKVAVVQSTAQMEPPQVVEPEISHPIGCENYRHLIEQYDWNVETFIKIADAESIGGLDGMCYEGAVGDKYPIKGILAPSCGLFQVRTLSSRPSCEALKDPATNIAWAYRIYQGQGYKAWSVCKTKVRCH